MHKFRQLPVKRTFPQNGKTWEITKGNVNKAIDSRFKELLIQWENDHQVYFEIHKQLLYEFRTRHATVICEPGLRLNLLEEELQGVDKAMHSMERQADYAKNRRKFSTKTKVIFGATSPLWIPFGVAGLVIGMPVLGAMAVKRKVDDNKKLDNYKKNPRDYLEKRSRKYLERLSKEHVLAYAQRQMENTKNVLSKYGDQIPILIEAGRKLVKHLSNETRTQDEVLRLYAPIEKKIVEMINKITPLGIELCPETVNTNDLEWKEEKESCFGEGEFSKVYKGKLKNAGGAKLQNSEINVAVKVFKQPFDDLNTRFFLDEEVKIRDLEHKNVLKYFGAARVSTPHESNKYKFIFVIKACQQNLRNVIFGNATFAPAKSKNSNQAIDKFKKWAMEIPDGLNYIHERGLTHRHLKLENILEDEDGTVIISDIGIVGQHLETERSITYLAPEVFEDQMNCTKEADIYSYGIMLWEMWYGKQAFTELMPIEIVEFRKELADGHRPKTGFTTISIPAIHAVMVKCWATKVEERYSAKECCRVFQDIIEG
ncbi:tyrosine-protein kinase transmembrane receptor Ror-like [Dendronephthya gigantea]|uniref:tyrosine-protein kinase transmembrane receptor Ror-like n=1 Tax=Dendronephthya gigantea TaxID=151771 RepID=UPI00106C721B|nr:tyrosine-protein kinase transmembrane receptor Ror-like [Dendronephthya gigantea]